VWGVLGLWFSRVLDLGAKVYDWSLGFKVWGLGSRV
jgi:hypothetical protein